MGNLYDHAKSELDRAGLFDKDSDYDGMLGTAVLELIDVFGKQDHSGCSANLVSNLFNKLSRYDVITTISDKESEWTEVREGHFQNKRCSALFKDEDGKSRYLNAIIWRTQTGSTWTGSASLKDGTELRSRQIVKFPFKPKTFYIDVIEKEISKDSWEFYIKDEKQLDEVFEYYVREKP